MVLFVIVSICTTIAAIFHWKDANYWRANIVSSITSCACVIMLATIIDGMSPFLPIACVVGTFYALVISMIVGIPFRWYRRRPGHGYCQKCGYNLHGLTEKRCPECGTPFAPIRMARKITDD